MIDRIRTWFMESKHRRILSHAIFGALIALFWVGVVAVLASFGNNAPSVWHGLSMVVGAYGWRELEDVILKDQGGELGWAEVVAPVITAAVVCAITSGGF